MGEGGNTDTVGLKYFMTERGGSVVTHETRIREVPGSNPGAEQPDWGFLWFSSVIKANVELDFHYHDPFDHYSSNSYIIKLKISELYK